MDWIFRAHIIWNFPKAMLRMYSSCTCTYARYCTWNALKSSQDADGLGAKELNLASSRSLATVGWTDITTDLKDPNISRKSKEADVVHPNHPLQWLHQKTHGPWWSTVSTTARQQTSKRNRIISQGWTSWPKNCLGWTSSLLNTVVHGCWSQNNPEMDPNNRFLCVKKTLGTLVEATLVHDQQSAPCRSQPNIATKRGKTSSNYGKVDKGSRGRCPLVFNVYVHR